MVIQCRTLSSVLFFCAPLVAGDSYWLSAIHNQTKNPVTLACPDKGILVKPGITVQDVGMSIPTDWDSAPWLQGQKGRIYRIITNNYMIQVWCLIEKKKEECVASKPLHELQGDKTREFSLTIKHGGTITLGSVVRRLHEQGSMQLSPMYQSQESLYAAGSGYIQPQN